VPDWWPPRVGPTGGYDPTRRHLAVWDVPEWRP